MIRARVFSHPAPSSTSSKPGGSSRKADGQRTGTFAGQPEIDQGLLAFAEIEPCTNQDEDVNGEKEQKQLIRSHETSRFVRDVNHRKIPGRQIIGPKIYHLFGKLYQAIPADILARGSTY
jgi:hypothetical protein